MSVVSLTSGREYSVERLLEVIDNLRADIASGEIVAFAATGIAPDGTTFHWMGSARVTSPMTMLGAIAKLHYDYASDL